MAYALREMYSGLLIVHGHEKVIKDRRNGQISPKLLTRHAFFLVFRLFSLPRWNLPLVVSCIEYPKSKLIYARPRLCQYTHVFGHQGQRIDLNDGFCDHI